MKNVSFFVLPIGRKTAKQGLFILMLGLSVASFAASSFATPRPTEGRTIKDLSGQIPLRVLQKSISREFYRSLLISPIDGWIVVGGQLSQAGFSGARVIRSSLGGAFDSVALKWADEMRIAVSRKTGTVGPAESVLVHFLIYHIADGTMFVSFPALDDPGGAQMKYFGCARLSVLKKDGRWEEIKGPEGLHGKGWAVRETRVRTYLSGEKLPRDHQAFPMLDRR
jgi:hypothetical protein